MSAADYAESERIIAKLIARAFIADNPHLFAPQQDQSEHSTIAGPRLHRCNGRALTPQEDGPAESERERKNETTESREA